MATRATTQAFILAEQTQFGTTIVPHHYPTELVHLAWQYTQYGFTGAENRGKIQRLNQYIGGEENIYQACITIIAQHFAHWAISI